MMGKMMMCGIKQLCNLTAAVLSVMLLTLCSCGGDMQNKLMIKTFAKSIDISEQALKCGRMYGSYDDHGGFHGDGKSLYCFSFDTDGDKKMTAEINSSGHWQPLPLTENISRFIYGDDGNDESDNLGDECNIPKASSGYYFLHDRYYEEYGSDESCFIQGSMGSEQMDEKNIAYTDLHLFDGYAVNLTFALYDKENGLLYILNFDT